MRTGMTSMLLGAVLFAGLLSGCKQQEGERCQIDDDCATNLYCQLNGQTREAGGYCISTTPTTTPTAPTIRPPDFAGTAPADFATTPPPADLTTAPPADLTAHD